MKKILMAAAVLASALNARALGLRTPFGEVIVNHLKIGQTYSLNDLVNLPLRVVNTGDQEVNLSIETIPTPPNEAREGYDPIPSLNWVRVAQSSFTFAPNHEVATDLIITIPNDPSLLGRGFEADIWSHTSSWRSHFGVGVVSKLLLRIDSTPPSEEELKKKFVDAHVANLDFTVLPSEKDIDEVPLGREIDLRKERKVAIKLVNPNDQTMSFRIRSIPLWESMIAPPDGYEAAFNPQWLKPDSDVVKVEGNSIGETSLKLNIPDEPRVHGKKFLFIVSVDVLEQAISTHVYFRLRATMPAVDRPFNKTQGDAK